MSARVSFFAWDEQIARIDQWRRCQPDMPTRGKAIRELLNFALNHAKENEKECQK